MKGSGVVLPNLNIISVDFILYSIYLKTPTSTLSQGTTIWDFIMV